MITSQKILDILDTSPSVKLLKMRNRNIIISFLIELFFNDQAVVASESLHTKLSDFLDHNKIETDDESDIQIFDTYEVKAKKYVRSWTDSGFLTNYQNDQGEIYYELSSHSSKTIDWLASLQKKEFVGAESRFKDIFNQLKELVEFTNDDVDKRIELLEEKKLEIEHQIQQLKVGQQVKVYEDFEIIPRYSQLTQAAKELLSDFKEVEENFKGITRQIYQKHAEGNLTKDHILAFTFEGLDQIKDSQQGKSFYAFWSFLLNPGLQEEWNGLTMTLFDTMEAKQLVIGDYFLKSMRKHLHTAGQKVYKANDKMADKLSRIIRESEVSKTKATKNLIQEIKTLLIQVSKKKGRHEISFTLDMAPEINLPFERRLTTEPNDEINYKERPKKADDDITNSINLGKLFSQNRIDKDIIRGKIRNILAQQAQATLFEIIEKNGGIENGLPELFGYLAVTREFKHIISPDQMQRVLFDVEQQKSIQMPNIILLK
jgi:hypothetical protein